MKGGDRADARVRMQRPCRLLRSGEELDATLADLSLTGFRIVSDATFKTGEPLRLLWTPVPGLPPLSFDVEVVRHHSRARVHGLRLRHLEGRERSVLAALIRFHRA